MTDRRDTHEQEGRPRTPNAGDEAATARAPRAEGKPAGAPVPQTAEELAEAREALARTETERDELKDSLLRLRAEFENYRKRMVREQTQFLERAVEGFVLQLLPIIDNLERAISAADEKHDLAQLSSGVQMVHAQLLDLFGKKGIEIIDPVGEPFDPTRHHAMMQVVDADHDDETVVEVVQKGYALKGKILRPAMVKVSTRPG